MRTKTIELFQYAELSDKAKAKARDWYREVSAGDTDFADFIINDFVTIAGFCGWSINQRSFKTVGGSTRSEPDVSWSLGYDQGDFAAFDGSWSAADVNVAGLKEHAPVDAILHTIAQGLAAVAKQYPDATGTVRYHHYYGVQFEFEPGDFSASISIEGCIESDWKQATRDLNRWLYEQIRSENDYQTSDNQVAETIEANEYEFRADGTRDD